MKQKLLYLIPPIVALALFLALYSSEMKRMDARKAEVAVEKDKLAAIEKGKKDAADAESAKQMAAKQKQKSEEDAKRVKDNEDKLAASRRKIADDTKEAQQTLAQRTQEIAALQAKFASLQKQRETLNHDYIEASKVVESLRADRRVAEIESERANAMIDQQLKDSPILTLPPGFVPGSIPGGAGLPPAGAPPQQQKKGG